MLFLWTQALRIVSEPVDFFLNGVNIAQATNLYHHQAYIEDLLYKPTHPIDIGAGWDKEEELKTRARGKFDLYFRLHNLLCNQDKLLIENIPILLRPAMVIHLVCVFLKVQQALHIP